MSCGGSDSALLWLATIAPIRPLAWEPPCATGAALKRQTNKQTKPQKTKEKKKKKKSRNVEAQSHTQLMPADQRANFRLNQRLIHVKKVRWEFLLWYSGIGGGISAAPGCRFDPWLAQWVKRIQHYCICGMGHNCGLDLIPGLGIPYAAGWPKKKKKKRSQINNTIINKLVSLFSDLKLHAKYCYTTSSLLYRIPRFHLLASPLKLNKDLLTLIFDLQSPYKGFWQVLLLFLFSDGRR